MMKIEQTQRATMRSSSTPVSALTLIGAAATLAAGAGMVGCNDTSPGNESASNGEPADHAKAWFEDVSATSGITFVHDNGHVDRYLMPENVPGGAALFDMDNDGDLDLYLVQSGDPVNPSANSSGNMLYENLGDWTFRDVTERAQTGDRGFGQGAACADYDNDGDVDLYVTNLGTNVLYRNNGDGSFSDVTATAGVGHPGWSTSATWLDYDRDGDLDLYVCTYINWAPDTEQDCFNKMGSLDYCAPRNYNSPGLDVLYRNNGDGTFADVTSAAGISASGNGLGVSSVDLNGDGYLDIFVANDQLPDLLWINRGDGTFTNEATARGCAVDTDGIAKAGMGVTIADVDGDADFDILVCNLQQETDSFYVNENGRFNDATLRYGLGAVSKQFTRFGMGWVDFNNDGIFDLYQANGRVARVPKTWSDDPYAEPNLLFRGTASGRFEEVDPRGGTSVLLVASSRAAVFGDIDNDGRIDVVVVNQEAPIHLLRNVTQDDHHWIGFRVLNANGQDAINAVVTVEAGGRSMVRDIRPGYSYLASNDPRAHFGLGGVSKIDRITVRWPDGLTSTCDGLAVDQYHMLRRTDDS
jgi:hypothetical protein